MELAVILATWNVSRPTVYHRLKECVTSRWKDLRYAKAPGRPARLTKTQKCQLSEWVKAGPEACGYPMGCWTNILIQDLIYQKFHVLYNRSYVCELLHHLGHSYQKARFVSDPLAEEARQRRMKEEWPRILSQARQLEAPVFFGFEDNFVLWGSWSSTWAPRGHQPPVKTTGLRKGYKVFGAVDFFSGRLLLSRPRKTSQQ